MKKIVGILVCMLMIIPVLATTVTAEPEIEIEIKGGFGINVELTNIGDEPYKGRLWRVMTVNFLNRSLSGNPVGMGEPIMPGGSSSYHIWPLFVPIFFAPLYGIPIINYCTITITCYESGSETIYGEKSVDALSLFGFVIILSE